MDSIFNDTAKAQKTKTSWFHITPSGLLSEESRIWRKTEGKKEIETSTSTFSTMLFL